MKKIGESIRPQFFSIRRHLQIFYSYVYKNEKKLKRGYTLPLIIICLYQRLKIQMTDIQD